MLSTPGVLYLINGVLTWPGEEFQGLTKIGLPVLGDSGTSLQVSKARLDVAWSHLGWWKVPLDGL